MSFFKIINIAVDILANKETRLDGNICNQDILKNAVCYDVIRRGRFNELYVSISVICRVIRIDIIKRLELLSIQLIITFPRKNVFLATKVKYLTICPLIG